MKDQSAAHLPQLDGLRALLALYVLLSHAYLTVWSIYFGHAPVPAGWTGALLNWLLFSRLAVDGFIVLSGFCLSLPVVRGDGKLRGGVGRFYWRRARRILPTFYAALVVCVILDLTVLSHKTGTQWDAVLPLKWQAVVGNILMLQGIAPLGGINHVFWSISVEWWIYFLFPLMLWIFAKMGAAIPVLIMVGLAQLTGHLLAPTELAPMNVDLVGCFAMGAAAARLAFLPRNDRLRRDLRPAILALIFLAVLIALCRSFGPRMACFWLYDLIGGLMFSFGIVALCRRNPLAVALGWGPLYWVGTFSYSLYLTHAPILQLVWQMVVHPLRLTGVAGFSVLLGVGLPSCLLGAWVFFLLFERPMMSSRQKRAVAQAEGDAAKSLDLNQKTIGPPTNLADSPHR